MHDERHAGKVFCIVPHHAHTSCAVDVKVIPVEMFEQQFFVGFCSRIQGGMPIIMRITDGRSERDVEQAVLLENPVIAISGREAQIPVFGLLEFQVIADRNVVGQFLIVKIQFVQIKGEAGFPCAAAFLLYGTLGIRCRIGKALVVEDIVGIDACRVASHTVKVFSLQLFNILVKAAQPTQFEVIARAAVNQIAHQHGRIKTQLKFRFGGFASFAQRIYIKGISKEKPAPAQVRTNLDARFWGEGDALRSPCILYGVTFKGIGVLEHHRPVVFVRLDVCGIGFVECPDKALDEIFFGTAECVLIYRHTAVPTAVRQPD